MAVVGALSFVFGVGCGHSARGPVREAAPQAVTPGAVARPELRRLVGSWVRPDGDYVLEILSVAPDGSVEAAYFNPRPIQVSLAHADWFDGSARLFVEFDDTNYRGSTYQLDHLADHDVLHGTYYQAEMGQTFEVVFVRQP